MIKSGVRDVATRNRQLIVRALLDKGPLSRIELSAQTHLSPSTVSRLVGNLLTRGILAEDTSSVQTAGRNRIPLVLNSLYGKVAAIEISPKSTTLYCYDMSLRLCEKEQICTGLLSGERLLEKIRLVLARVLGNKIQMGAELRGVGLLFCEGLTPSSVSLHGMSGYRELSDALASHLEVPVLEERDETFLARAAAERYHDESIRSYALISLGSRVLVSIVMDQSPIVLRDGACADVSDAVGWTDAVRSAGHPLLDGRIASLVATLLSLFALDRVFIFSRSPRMVSCLSEMGLLGDVETRHDSTSFGHGEKGLFLSHSHVVLLKPVSSSFSVPMASVVREAALEAGIC